MNSMAKPAMRVPLTCTAPVPKRLSSPARKRLTNSVSLNAVPLALRLLTLAVRSPKLSW